MAGSMGGIVGGREVSTKMMTVVEMAMDSSGQKSERAKARNKIGIYVGLSGHRNILYPHPNYNSIGATFL